MIAAAAIPAELTRYSQWVVWRRELRDGKPTKVPYNARTGQHASSTDPDTWSRYDQALAVGTDYDGIGIVLTAQDPLTGIDLDHCRDSQTGTIEPWAQEIVAALRSYTEITPSNTGLRIFCRGVLPPGGRKKGNIEIYDRARFLTVTGRHLDGTPTRIEDRADQLRTLHRRIFGAPAPPALSNGRPVALVDLDDAALLERARAATNGARFSCLWAGDLNGYPSASEADLALCNHLAFWTGRDAARMDRLFRTSGLMREKWDARHGAQTYGAMTIAKAIAECGDVYQSRPNQARASVTAPISASSLRTLTWRELTAEPAAPIVYHWEGWVPLAAVALVVGAGEAFKSWLTLLLAICTAAGRAPLVEPEDRTAIRIDAGPVLYFTAENAIEEERRRATLLKAPLGLPDDLPITFVPSESLNLSSEDDFAAVVALVQDVQPAAVFIDSAIALSGLPEENDNAEVRAFMKSRILPLARAHGCTVYLVAHSPKPPTQPGARLGDEHVVRGASDWRNAADIVLSLKRDPTLGSAAVVLKHAKVRIGRRHAPIWFSLEDVDPGISVRMIYGGGYDEDTEQGAALGLARAVRAAVAVLKDQPSGTYLETAKMQLVAAKIAEATARRALDVIRGKTPWPHGKLKGQKHPIVTEDKHGRRVFIALELSNMPDDEDPDDA